MPARFHTVSPSIWNRQMRTLSKDAVIVASYVYSCRDRRSEGLFELASVRVAADTPLSVEEVEAAFDELDRAGLIAYDAENEIVLDRLALRTNPLRHGRDKQTGEIRPNKAMPCAVQHFHSIPDSALKVEFVSLAMRFSPDLAHDLREAPSIPLGSPYGGGSRGRGVPSRGEGFREEHAFDKETEGNRAKDCPR